MENLIVVSASSSCSSIFVIAKTAIVVPQQ